MKVTDPVVLKGLIDDMMQIADEQGLEITDENSLYYYLKLVFDVDDPRYYENEMTWEQEDQRLILRNAGLF